jgi:hypothetical protein
VYNSVPLSPIDLRRVIRDVASGDKKIKKQIKTKKKKPLAELGRDVTRGIISNRVENKNSSSLIHIADPAKSSNSEGVGAVGKPRLLGKERFTKSKIIVDKKDAKRTTLGGRFGGEIEKSKLP